MKKQLANEQVWCSIVSIRTFQLIGQQCGIATIVDTIYNIMHASTHNVQELVTHFCICSANLT